MEVRFKMKPILAKIEFKDPQTNKPLHLDGADVLWSVDANNKLQEITITFKGVKIVKDSEDIISTTNRELDENAFKIATYISNKVFLETGIDVINPESILDNSPTIFPENKKEKEIIEASKKQGFATFKAKCNINRVFNLGSFEEEFKYSKAIVFYAEAKRTENPIQKYELLYKVIEYFFPNKLGDKLDREVSDYCKEYNLIYGSKEFIELFRKLRNRCIHPDNKEHANLEDLASIREVIDMVAKIEELVELLIKNPRF